MSTPFSFIRFVLKFSSQIMQFAITRCNYFFIHVLKRPFYLTYANPTKSQFTSIILHKLQNLE